MIEIMITYQSYETSTYYPNIIEIFRLGKYVYIELLDIKNLNVTEYLSSQSYAVEGTAFSRLDMHPPECD